MNTTLPVWVGKDQRRLLADLIEWLRIPSISTLPAHKADCRRAHQWIADRLGATSGLQHGIVQDRGVLAAGRRVDRRRVGAEPT